MQAQAQEPWRVVLFSVLAPQSQLMMADLAKAGHRVVGIVTAPGPRSRRTDDYRAVAALARPGLDVIISNYPDRWAAMIAPLRPDLILTGGFNWVIPADVLAVPRLGAVNFHDGLLPRYRGMNATGWALRNDEAQLGFTAHRMTPRLDDGSILAQRAMPLGDDDDIETIRAWQATNVPMIFQEMLARIAAGEPGTPQWEEAAYSTPGRFEEGWRWIDWSQPARAIHLQVRSWIGTRDQPRGALGWLDGTLIRVIKTALPPTTAATTVAPGTLLDRDDATLTVQCGDGPLRLLRWQVEEAATVAE